MDGATRLGAATLTASNAAETTETTTTTRTRTRTRGRLEWSSRGGGCLVLRGAGGEHATPVALEARLRARAAEVVGKEVEVEVEVDVGAGAADASVVPVVRFDGRSAAPVLVVRGETKTVLEVRALRVVGPGASEAKKTTVHAVATLVAASPECTVHGAEGWFAALSDGTILWFRGRSRRFLRSCVRVGTRYSFCGSFEKTSVDGVELWACAPTDAESAAAVEIHPEPDSVAAEEEPPPTSARRRALAHARAETRLFAYEGTVTRRVNEWTIELDHSIQLWMLHAPLPARLWLGVRPGAVVRLTQVSPLRISRVFVGFALNARSDMELIRAAPRPAPPLVRFELESPRDPDGLVPKTLLRWTITEAFTVLRARDLFASMGISTLGLAALHAMCGVASTIPNLNDDATSNATDTENQNNPDALAEFAWDWERPLGLTRGENLRLPASLAEVAWWAIEKQQAELLREGGAGAISAQASPAEVTVAETPVAHMLVVCRSPTPTTLGDGSACLPVLSSAVPLPASGAVVAITKLSVLVERFGETAALTREAVFRSLRMPDNSSDATGIVSRGADDVGVTRVGLVVSDASLVSAEGALTPLSPRRNDTPPPPTGSSTTTTGSPLPTLTVGELLALPNLPSHLATLRFVVDAAKMSYDSFEQSKQQGSASRLPRVLACGSLVMRARDLASPATVDLYVDLGASGLVPVGVARPGAVVEAAHVDVRTHARSGRVYLKADSARIRACTRDDERAAVLSFPRDLALVTPRITLSEFRRLSEPPSSSTAASTAPPKKRTVTACVRASVVSVNKLWLTWRCGVVPCSAQACADASHAGRVLRTSASVDVDDGSDVVSAFAMDDVALTLVGIPLAKARAACAGLASLNFDKFAYVVGDPDSPAFALMELVLGNAARRARGRVMFLELDRPPPPPDAPLASGRSRRRAVDFSFKGGEVSSEAVAGAAADEGAGEDDAESDASSNPAANETDSEEETTGLRGKRSRRADEITSNGGPTMMVKLRGGRTTRTRIVRKLYARVVSVEP